MHQIRWCRERHFAARLDQGLIYTCRKRRCSDGLYHLRLLGWNPTGHRKFICRKKNSLYTKSQQKKKVHVGNGQIATKGVVFWWLEGEYSRKEHLGMYKYSAPQASPHRKLPSRQWATTAIGRSTPEAPLQLSKWPKHWTGPLQRERSVRKALFFGPIFPSVGAAPCC